MREGFLALNGQGEGTRLGRILKKMLLICAALIGLIVLAQNVLVVLREWGFLKWALLAVCLATLAAGLWGLSKLKWSTRKRLVCTLILCGALRILYVLLVRTPPESDFGLMYDAALKTAAGDFAWAEVTSGYFYNWGYQIPFVAYQALILKLFPSVWALKAVGLLWMVGIDYLIYRLGRSFFSERAAVAAAALYAVYPASIHMASVLTNQHIATFFLLLGLVLLVERKEWPWMLVAGVCLSLGNLMRPEGVVMLASLAAGGLCLFLRWPGKVKAFTLVRWFALLLVAYFALSAGAGVVLKAAGVAPNGIGNQRPEWKFVLGLDMNGNGGYQGDNEYILDMEDDAARKAEMKRIIADSARANGNIPAFFAGKSALMWAADDHFFWSLQFLYPDGEVLPGVGAVQLQKLLVIADKAVYLLAWAAVPLSCLFLWRRGEGDKSGCAMVLLFMVCAAYCVYLLVEVQARYRYFVMPAMFILAGFVMDQTLYRIKPKNGGGKNG